MKEFNADKLIGEVNKKVSPKTFGQKLEDVMRSMRRIEEIRQLMADPTVIKISMQKEGLRISIERTWGEFIGGRAVAKKLSDELHKIVMKYLEKNAERRIK